MSKAYDLEIIKSVRAVLIVDNVDPDAPSELCIHSFIEDNVFLNDTNQTNVNFPQITLDFITGNGDGDLPVEHGELRVMVWYDINSPSARVLCRKCAARVSGLIDHNPDILNDNNSDITVRLVDEFSSIIIPEQNGKLIRGLITFDVIYKKVR